MRILLLPPLQTQEIQPMMIKQASGRFIFSMAKNGDGPLYF